MNVIPVTSVLRAGALVGLAALVFLPAAAGHVTVAPATVDAGATSTLRFTVPNERAPRSTVGVIMTFPPGWKPVSAPSQGAWHANVADNAISWSGGRLSDSRAVTFAVLVHPSSRAGTYALDVRQRYDDGRVASWQVLLATLPATGSAAPSGHLGRALVAGVVGFAVIVALLAVLHAVRRRRGHRTV
jgi:hypothetical protein